MFRVLRTNLGAHPPDKWALFTAQDIFDISKLAPGGDREIAARRAQLAIADALTAHHAKVQADEKANLAADPEHAMTAHEVDHYLDDAAEAVVAAVKGSPWADHYKGAAADAMADVLEYHFKTAQSIERMWHADRTGNAAAVAYKTAHQGV